MGGFLLFILVVVFKGWLKMLGGFLVLIKLSRKFIEIGMLLIIMI